MTILPRILVTGANGQLGKELRELEALYPQFEFLFASREDLPIHHFEMLRHYFSVYKPAYVINAAAYTAVDRAETEKDKAFQVNGEAVGVLAAICRQQGARLVHISTDYVFDGKGNRPYKEEDATNPQNVYGASKLKGEAEIGLYNPDAIVIRSSWIYSSYGKNFVKTMLRLMQEKKEISVVNDQFGSPTYAADLAEAILEIIASGNWVPGIYHYCNEGVISWYDFAVAIREMIASNCTVHPITTDQYPTAAKRPAYSALDTGKASVTYGLYIKPWKESLQTCLGRLK